MAIMVVAVLSQVADCLILDARNLIYTVSCANYQKLGHESCLISGPHTLSLGITDLWHLHKVH